MASHEMKQREKVIEGHFMTRHDVLLRPKPVDSTSGRQCENTVIPVWYLETQRVLRTPSTVHPKAPLDSG